MIRHLYLSTRSINQLFFESHTVTSLFTYSITYFWATFNLEFLFRDRPATWHRMKESAKNRVDVNFVNWTNYVIIIKMSYWLNQFLQQWDLIWDCRMHLSDFLKLQSAGMDVKDEIVSINWAFYISELHTI